MAKDFVSVLIDTYNHERFIEEAVSSVLAQDFPAADREVIVVDDGSTDRTPEILSKFASQVRILRKPNGGQASAFNQGIPECRGEIVAFLDGDDWWAPQKLSRVVQAMTANRSLGIVGHGIVQFSTDGSTRLEAPDKAERFTLDCLAAARLFRMRKSFLGTSRMVIRADLLRRIGPVPTTLTIEADEYLFTLGAALGEVMILPETLTYYRLHGTNLYNAGGGDCTGLRRKGQVVHALASSLRSELPMRGVIPQVIQCVVEIVQAESDQIRLTLDGGAPWETVQVERKIYRIMHEGAPFSHRLFKNLIMLFALMLPPRWFYAGRRWLGSKKWYNRARRLFLPVPKLSRVAGPEEFKA